MRQNLHKLFMLRTKDAYHNQKKRAAKYAIQLDFDLPTLRHMVNMAMGNPCPYCQEPITVKTFSIDHKEPVSRNGSFSVHNLLVCCDRCNDYKGNMNAREYVDLRDLLSKWPEEIATNILARLRAGGRIMRV